MGDSDSLAEELGEVSGFIDVVYREMCAAHAAELAALEERKVTDTAELLQTLAQFPETQFKQYLAAEAPVLRKNSRRSQQLREEGNRAYTAGRNEQALKLYTESVRFAPFGEGGTGEDLSLAFANRSAVLAQLKLFRLALQDIRLSLQAGYPAHLQYKLHERRAKCCKEEKQFR